MCGGKVIAYVCWERKNAELQELITQSSVWREINNPVYWESNDAVWKESNDIVWAVAGKK